MSYHSEYYLKNRTKINAKSREWRAKNKARANASLRTRARERKLKIIEHMGGKCFDCSGVFPPAVYDLHHLDEETKTDNIGHMKAVAWSRVVEELAKCVLLCSNCHRIRHSKEENV